MLRPLPGSSGYRIEQMPISRPAAAIAGIRTQEWYCTLGRATVITRLNARPMEPASGAMASAKNANK
jgi:hypothetical protein